jgi:hypothetical protein
MKGETFMKKTSLILLLMYSAIAYGETQLTVYNQDFAVVKEQRLLELKKGENELRVTDITAHLEPDSVVLRDIKDANAIQILEQNYESDPLSEGLLLRKSEGKVLDFEITVPQTNEKKIIQGKILRSGYIPHTSAFQRYGYQYEMTQRAYASPQGGGQPIVEVDGKIQFGLPGKPIFESLDPKAFLKPTLLWRLWAKKGGKHDTEFSYLTGGLSWEATYNAVAPEKGDVFDLIGWVTLENMSGKDFENAAVKLMAGDVSRVQPAGYGYERKLRAADEMSASQPQAVSERTFEEYHLYTLGRPVTLLDREIKQVEFIRAANVPAKRIYVYDGFKLDERYRHYSDYDRRQEPQYGTICNPKVWAMLEFKNSKESNLGMPLPKGKVKLYRRDIDGRNEFIGEDEIDHTPKDETVMLYTGNAFDVVGERRQTNFKVNINENWMDESFEIKVRNHKKDEVEVRVIEHLYRWVTWDITAKSMDFSKKDARTIEFREKIPADGEAVITYTVHYTW